MSAPAVSVVMAVYNGEPWLGEALASILGQSLIDLEFIVVDDGSTDGTPKRLAAIGDTRMSVLRQSRGGQTAALNRGLRAAPERDLRPPRAAARADRLLVAERRPRARAAREGDGAAARLLCLRLDREQGRRLLERPARVVGGRRRDRPRPALSGVVREPAQVRPARAAGRPQQADPRAEGRDDGSRRTGGELAHRIDVRTRDELQDLGEQFNRMAGRLQESYATLEQKVDDRTRELTEALKRRCLYLWLDYPDLEHELRIVHLHSPELDEQVARKLVEIVHRIRELDLKKPPSIAESIDWARTLILLGASDIDRGTFEETMSVILKHRTDMDTVASRVGVMLDPAVDAA